jgi:hypothetical protein
MKWPSRIAVVAAVLALCLLVRSTRVRDRIDLWWTVATLSVDSANGELSVEASFAGEPALVHSGFLPAVWRQQQPVSMGGQFEFAVLGNGFDTRRPWSGAGFVLCFPHWSLILGLLAVPAARLAVRRLRGRAKPPSGFQIETAS